MTQPHAIKWVLTDGTEATANGFARDPRNIYWIGPRALRARLQKHAKRQSGAMTPEELFAPRRTEHIRKRDALDYKVGPPEGAVKPLEKRKARPQYVIITPPARRAP